MKVITVISDPQEARKLMASGEGRSGRCAVIVTKSCGVTGFAPIIKIAITPSCAKGGYQHRPRADLRPEEVL